MHLLHVQDCAPVPCPVACDKGFAGAGIEHAAAGLGHVLVRPRHQDEPERVFPGWLRQRIEAISWTLKDQLGLERHQACTTEGPWARVCQRIVPLNAVIWRIWLMGTRSSSRWWFTTTGQGTHFPTTI